MSARNLTAFDKMSILTNEEVIEQIQRVGLDFEKWKQSFLPQTILNIIGESIYEQMIEFDPDDEEGAREDSKEIILKHAEPIAMIRTEWGIITGNYLCEKIFVRGEDEPELDDDEVDPNFLRVELTLYSDRFSALPNPYPFREQVMNYLLHADDESNIDVVNAGEKPVVAQIGIEFEQDDDKLAAQEELKTFFLALLSRHNLSNVMFNGFAEVAIA